MSRDPDITYLKQRLRVLEKQVETIVSIQCLEPRIERQRSTLDEPVTTINSSKQHACRDVRVSAQSLKKMFHEDKQVHLIMPSFPSITRDGYPIERRDTLFLEFHDYVCNRVKGLKRPTIQTPLGSYNNNGNSIDTEVNKDIRIFSPDINALLDVLYKFFSIGSELDQDTLAVEIDEELRLFKVKEMRTVEVEIVQ